MNFFLINLKLGYVKRNNKCILVFLLALLLFSLSCFAFEDGQDNSKDRSFDALQKSLLIPGWGQFAEKKYLKGAVFLSAEIYCLYKIFENNHRGNENYLLYKEAGNVDDVLKYRELTEKYGFSVVAPIRINIPDSTSSSRTSCWARLKRCISSMKRTVLSPPAARVSLARAIIRRISLTLAAGALR